MICPECGRQPRYTVERYQYRESGLDNVFVDGVGIFRCVCGQEYIQLPGAQEVHNQVASALLTKTSLLTGPEARFLRKWLRLTSDELAKALGYTRVSVSRRENKGLTVATDRSLRLFAAQMGNISINVEKLFSTISEEPNQKFKIVIGEIPSAPQYSTNVYGTALALASPTESLDLRPFAALMKPCIKSLELATTVLDSSVDVFGTTTSVTSAQSYTNMLINFDETLAISCESAGVTGREPDSAANQELAWAA